MAIGKDVAMKPINTRPALETLKDHKNLIGVEIGVYDGDNARYILDTLDIKKLFLIDKWDNPKQYELVYSTFRDDNRVVTIRKYSSKAIRWFDSFEDNFLDFVYIDANHEYMFVKEDIELWTPKVKQGGLIAGHDFNSSPGVRKAVQETYFIFNRGFSQEKEDWWVTKI